MHLHENFLHDVIQIALAEHPKNETRHIVTMPRIERRGTPLASPAIAFASSGSSSGKRARTIGSHRCHQQPAHERIVKSSDTHNKDSLLG